MNRILDILIPRFFTERVALLEATAGHLEIACAISERTSRNRHLFDSNAADGHCVYPRSAQ
ncbi:hypothetical protein [Pseudomonas aeruginosa]|uniref:hypothetical protein n=1 Tax=Pseudomonas aeruginosa group TaxID=136841 RepID=UPI000DED24D5|nr:hypothetical protein [Pseudomonas aeruginosa]MCT5424759.1 hypothetical protein [Pseudomonas aeruginosa]MDY1342377.1 hypothetical protein [Pseudomonas aeruginosa]RCI50514.1 hypothetical protein DT381_21900 [Pseudomonas aeruginosa]RIY94884.1 hypothetical protein AXW94_22215 [Pseudomonas aeruginosa]HBN8448203.1 hypothetical protein [Pseudomonas aeruginosa]